MQKIDFSVCEIERRSDICLMQHCKFLCFLKYKSQYNNRYAKDKWLLDLGTHDKYCNFEMFLTENAGESFHLLLNGDNLYERTPELYFLTVQGTKIFFCLKFEKEFYCERETILQHITSNGQRCVEDHSDYRYLHQEGGRRGENELRNDKIAVGCCYIFSTTRRLTSPTCGRPGGKSSKLL